MSPAHPTLMALSSPSLLPYYSDFADIVVAWSLPVPRAPITALARIVAAAVEATAGERPVWAVIQAAGGAWYEDAALDPSDSGRRPTPAEVRAMTYLSLVHGATGLIYYGYDIPSYPGTRRFQLREDAPELWATLPQINRELQWLSPVFLQGERRLLPTASDGDLHLAAWHYDGGDYIVVVNTSDRGVIADFALPDIAARQLSVMFEQRAITCSDQGTRGEPSPDEHVEVRTSGLGSPRADFTAPIGTFQDSFAPHDVHVYATR